MTIPHAIEKAIAGGWKDRLYRVDTGNTEVWTHDESMFLDPAFWRALGKTEGWGTLGIMKTCLDGHTEREISVAEMNSVCLTNHLWDGGTIESYFASL